MKTVFVAERRRFLNGEIVTLGLAQCSKGAEEILAAAGKGLEQYEWTIEEQEVEPCRCS